MDAAPEDGAEPDVSPDDTSAETSFEDTAPPDTHEPDTQAAETTVPIPDTTPEVEPGPECVSDADCDGERPICTNQICVGCIDALDCTAVKPVCASTAEGPMCITGYLICSGDDAREHSDDGPKGATQLSLGALVSGKICGDSADPDNRELDWFAFTIGSTRDLEITLSWPATSVDLDLALRDTDLEVVRPGGSSGHNPETIWVEGLPAGTYYLVVDGVEGALRTAVSYELAVYDITTRCDRDEQCRDAARPFCDLELHECAGCRDDLDCSAARPVCGATMDGPTCITGYVVCSGDDAREHADDGPRGATQVTLGTPMSGKICGDPTDPDNRELDWFRFTSTSTRDLEITLSWGDTSVDLDVALLDADLEVAFPGGSSGQNPETIWVQDLPPGTYYVVVDGVRGAPKSAVPYALVVYDITTRCDRDEQCLDAARPFCDLDNHWCAGCRGDLDCSPAKPVCAPALGGASCIEGYDECTGDDGAENRDDGPAGATVLSIPSTVEPKICGREGTPSALELDWFVFTLGATRDVEITMAWWLFEHDLDFWLVDAALAPLGIPQTGASELHPEILRADDLPPGTYYIAAHSLHGPPSAAIDYQLDIAFGVTCTQDAQCTDPLRPRCDVDAGVCGACAGLLDCPAELPVCYARGACGVIDPCTGDDAREHRDDGPSGATQISGEQARFDGKICGEVGTNSEYERDWFVMTLAQARSVTSTLAWTDAEVDLDLLLLDSAFRVIGRPEVSDTPQEVVAKTLEPGTYYLFVVSRSGAPTAAIPYTLDVLTVPAP